MEWEVHGWQAKGNVRGAERGTSPYSKATKGNSSTSILRAIDSQPSEISLAFAKLTILSNLCKMVYNVTHGITDASDKVSKVIPYAPWENYFTH